MYCDFATVTDILSHHLSGTSIGSYKGLLETLFSSFLKKNNKFVFEKQEVSKYHNRKRRLPEDLVDFYLKSDHSLIIGDIQCLLKFIFDKEQLYLTLYHLVINDKLLSVVYRRGLLNRIQHCYTDDASLSNLICEVIYTAIGRPYYLENGLYVVKSYYDPDNTMERDIMFSNGKPVQPCKHFCGRKEEINALHSLLQTESKVFVTGIQGIGKSEFVRAYIKQYQSEYTNIGYYFYNGDLRSVIVGLNPNIAVSNVNVDTLYQTNLEVLHSLDKRTLIVIDNFNAVINKEDCLNDLLDLDCAVICTSHRHYEDVCTFELKGFELIDTLELFGKFYSFTANERNTIVRIANELNFHTYSIELAARLLKKGLYTPETLLKKLATNSISSIAESISAKKDKSITRNSISGHIGGLFHLEDCPEEYRKILCMLISALGALVRKDTAAKLMHLSDATTIEELVDAGLLSEYDDGSIAMPPMVRDIVMTELRPDEDNCRTIIDSIRTVCKDELLTAEIGNIGGFILSLTDYNLFANKADFFFFLHDCFRYMKRIQNVLAMQNLQIKERNVCDKDNLCQYIPYLSDTASYFYCMGKKDLALEILERAVSLSRDCNDILLRAETLCIYGCYLIDADRKKDAETVLEQSITLFNQQPVNDAICIGKCNAITSYAKLLLSASKSEDAINMLTEAVELLDDRNLTNREVYADCLYMLGICHIAKKNDSTAKTDLSSAFDFYLHCYDRQSDMIQSKLDELMELAVAYDSDIMETEPLRKLFL